MVETRKVMRQVLMLFNSSSQKRHDAMILGDRPKPLRRPFNPMSHVGTHAQQSSL